MDTISNYKNRALASLKGYWSDAVVITLIYIAIYLVVNQCVNLPFGVTNPNASAGVSLLSLFVLLPLGWAMYNWFLSLVRGQKDGFGALFNGFTNGRYLKVLGTSLLYSLIVIVGFILLIVPGIYFACRYAMVFYILRDNPEMPVGDILKTSTDMMQGKKMKFFLLQLSFIGWAILSILTFGIGILWLCPYQYSAYAHFYEDAKAEYGVVEPEL